jgi:hypothetical protein
MRTIGKARRMLRRLRYFFTGVGSRVYRREQDGVILCRQVRQPPLLQRIAIWRGGIQTVETQTVWRRIILGRHARYRVRDMLLGTDWIRKPGSVWLRSIDGSGSVFAFEYDEYKFQSMFRGRRYRKLPT